MAAKIDVAGLARRLFDEHAARAPYRPLTDALDPTDLDGGYDVQEALHALWREHGHGTIVGYKIALTSKAMQEMCGIDQPLAAAIFSSVVHRSPATLYAEE